MRKRLTISLGLSVTIVFFFSVMAFGQGGAQWTSWQKANCYSGISYSVANMGYGKEAGGYLWGIRFRNDYDIPVQFGYKLTIGEEDKSEYGFNATGNLKPGEIWTDGGDLFTAKLFKSSSINYFYRIRRVCFNKPYCGEKCFAECDVVPGKPNQQSDCGGNSSSPDEEKTNSGEKNNPNAQGGKSTSVTMETEIIELANYVCQMMQIEKMYGDKEPDDATAKKYKEINKKAEGLSKLIEKKYPSEKDQSLAKTILDKELSKCSDESDTKNSSPVSDKSQINNNTKNNSQYNAASIVIENGVWIADNSTAKINVDIEKVSGGLSWKIQNVEMTTNIYKKISANEYRYADPDGVSYCLIKIKSSKKFDRYCNDHYVGEFTFVSSVVNKANPDIAAMNGEWNSDDGLYTVINETRGNGFDAWSKNDETNKVYYKKVAANEYRYTSPSGTQMVLKMINNDRLESFQNGSHFGYFSRQKSSLNQSKTSQAETNDFPQGGKWHGETDGITVTTDMIDGGLNFTIGEKATPFFFKLTPAGTYKLADDSIIDFINKDRFRWTSFGKEYYYDRISIIK